MAITVEASANFDIEIITAIVPRISVDSQYSTQQIAPGDAMVVAGDYFAGFHLTDDTKVADEFRLELYASDADRQARSNAGGGSSINNLSITPTAPIEGQINGVDRRFQIDGDIPTNAVADTIYGLIRLLHDT